MAITGECFCGAVSYQVNQPLRDPRSCHCSRCRKAFSAQASAYAEIEPGSFQWRTGQEMLTSYVNAQGFGLQFCRRCGSTLCGIHHGEVHGIALGCLNDDPNIELSQHIYVASKAPWEILPAGVDLHPEAAPLPG